MIQPALILPPEPDERWELAKQIGVTDAVIHPKMVGNQQTHWTYEGLLRLKNWLESDDLSLSVIEGSVPITNKIRFGIEGRDEDIEEFKQFLRNCGDLNIPIVAYDWSGSHWARTEAHINSRGGSLTTSYDNTKMKCVSHHTTTETTHEDLWKSLEYFLQEVGPVAAEAGVKLALHPDDPPRSEVGGSPRIITSIEAYDRVLNIHDHECNGITFCQGNFAVMGVDIPETIRHFNDRIHFIHFRDVEGDADKFTETWHDNGPTDMSAAMHAYKKIGFDGPMRPDHVPTMAGEDNSNPGYHTKGRLFAIGYITGLLAQM